MGVRLTHDDERMMLTLEVFAAPEREEIFGEFARRMTEFDRSQARHLLLDLSGLEADLGVDDLAGFVADAAPVLKRYGAAKTAAVVSGRTPVAALAMSMLFNAGLPLALFPSRADAVAWLSA